MNGHPRDWTPGEPGATCTVCGRTVDYYLWHPRLEAAVCLDCPITDARGEDLTGHCMLHVTETEIRDDTPVPDFASHVQDETEVQAP